MYLPKHFEEKDLESMHGLIRAQPLATLVTLSEDGLNANHIPLVLCESPAPYGKLQGHIPRANAMTKHLVEGVDALAVFHGPNDYITPSWYATKQTTGKVVPTWNYAVVHAYGPLRAIEDKDWIKAQIETLTMAQESHQKTPWRVADAPDMYIDKLVKALLGIEIVITRLQGKTKVSQNQSGENADGVVKGLESINSDSSNALAALTKSKTSYSRK